MESDDEQFAKQGGEALDLGEDYDDEDEVDDEDEQMNDEEEEEDDVPPMAAP
jgi:hypothetical protein